MVLKITINYNSDIITFSGSGTFQAKDEIKAIGGRWNGANKTWEIRPAKLSIEFLKEKFADSEVEEIGENKLEMQKKISSDIFDDIQKNPTNQNFPPHQSVSEFLLSINNIIQNNFLAPIYICGIINKITQSQYGHFIDIADTENSSESVSCSVWESQGLENVFSDLIKLGITPEADLPVLIKVKVGFNTKKAQISLNIIGVVADYTSGKLQAQRDITNQQLILEGIFEKQKELVLPKLPRTIGLITSSAGTVVNDFIAGLESAEFAFNILWFDSSMQGNAAIADIKCGLQSFNKNPDIDLVVLIRGGGSVADLAIFNSYEIAREICLSSKPVISAIGHEKDMSSAQDVSFISCGVPKMVGDYLARLIIDIKQTFDENILNISRNSTSILDIASRDIANFKNTIPEYIKAKIEKYNVGFVRLAQYLPTLASHIIKLSELNIINYEERFKELDPKKQLKRGFLLARMGDKYITNAKKITAGDEVELEFYDARKKVVVK